jgi:hypothetical protein
VARAVADGEEDGFLKIHTREGTDEILGATIVASHAGEMINGLSLAISSGIGLTALAQVIHSYPTQAEAIKMAADAYERTLGPVRKLRSTTAKGSETRGARWTVAIEESSGRPPGKKAQSGAMSD